MLLIFTLRARLLLVVLLSFIPLAGFLLHTRSHLADMAREERAAELLTVARNSAQVYQRAILETRTVFSVLAQIPELRTSGTAACEDFLPRILDEHEYFAVLGTIDLDGYTDCTAPALQDPIYLGDRRYVAEAFRTGHFTIGEYQVGRISGRPTVAVVLPVPGSAGSPAYLLAAGLDLQRLALTTPPGGIPALMSVTVFDRDGMVLARSAEEGSSGPGDRVSEPLREAASIVRSPVSAGLLPDVDGISRLFAVAPLNDPAAGDRPGAFVAVGFDPRNLELDVSRILRGNLIGILLAGLFSVAGIWLMLELSLLRRLSRVADAAERLGRGDWEARAGLEGADDEVGRLARSFDRMAVNLKDLREQESRWARDEIREREERFRQIAENIDGVFWLMDPETRRTLYVSPAVQEVWGLTPEEFLAVGEPESMWQQTIHPDDRERALSLSTKEHSWEGEAEYRIVRPDGAVRWIRERTFAVRDQEGRIIRVAGISEDITDRRRLELQVRQAQKMEAVGRLAGGVAHDFNNILTTIMGHSQLIYDELDEDSAIRADLEQIDQAARRAAGLTGQLLAFSRKQMVEPRPILLNRVIQELKPMLRRTVGPDVELTLNLESGLNPVEADPGQMTQILLNLAMNARDAMPAGGRLTVETANVKLTPEDAAQRPGEPIPGAYVMLTVSDTGQGIDPALRNRVFEPFFTTKEVGRGTGMGLATVYGIVKQSGGYIWVESEEGAGSSFSIYLPELDAAGESTDGHAAELLGTE